MNSRTEALADARKLCRTIASAPAPDARAREIFSALYRAEGWTPSQARKITEFGGWLNGRPAPEGLKARCEELLKGL